MNTLRGIFGISVSVATVSLGWLREVDLAIRTLTGLVGFIIACCTLAWMIADRRRRERNHDRG